MTTFVVQPVRALTAWCPDLVVCGLGGMNVNLIAMRTPRLQPPSLRSRQPDRSPHRTGGHAARPF